MDLLYCTHNFANRRRKIGWKMVNRMSILGGAILGQNPWKLLEDVRYSPHSFIMYGDLSQIIDLIGVIKYYHFR